MPIISTIIPIYNSIQYIDKCLTSVLNQTFQDIEVICIDDGSTDGTSEILDSYAERDKRVKVIHKKNEGLVKARKVGIQEAEGRYISFVDSDDWLELCMYEKMYKLAIKYDVDATGCGYYVVKNNTCVKTETLLDDGLYTNDTSEKKIYESLYSIEKSRRILNYTYWAYLFKKNKIYDSVMFVDDNVEVGEDLVGVWRFLIHASKIFVTNEAFYFYRVVDNSSCRRENSDILFGLNKVYKILKQEFLKSAHANELILALKYLLYNTIQSGNCFTNERQDFFMFPYEKIPYQSRIIIYGAGLVGKSYYRQIKENHFCEIVLWVDQSYENISCEKYKVFNPKNILGVMYDYIVIAMVNYESIEDIANELVEKYLIPKEKMIIYEPKRLSRYVDLS